MITGRVPTAASMARVQEAERLLDEAVLLDAQRQGEPATVASATELVEPVQHVVDRACACGHPQRLAMPAVQAAAGPPGGDWIELPPGATGSMVASVVVLADGGHLAEAARVAETLAGRFRRLAVEAAAAEFEQLAERRYAGAPEQLLAIKLKRRRDRVAAVVADGAARRQGIEVVR